MNTLEKLLSDTRWFVSDDPVELTGLRLLYHKDIDDFGRTGIHRACISVRGWTKESAENLAAFVVDKMNEDELDVYTVDDDFTAIDCLATATVFGGMNGDILELTGDITVFFEDCLLYATVMDTPPVPRLEFRLQRTDITPYRDSPNFSCAYGLVLLGDEDEEVFHPMSTTFVRNEESEEGFIPFLAGQQARKDATSMNEIPIWVKNMSGRHYAITTTD